MRKRKLLCRLTVVIVLVGTPALARVGEPPVSFGTRELTPLDDIVLVELPPVYAKDLLQRDREREGRVDNPPAQFAEPVATGLMRRTFTLDRLDDGSRLWRLRIRSRGARSINIGFTTFELPEGAQLWIYDLHGRDVEGPYTRNDQTRRGRFWTPVITGDEVVVEIFAPSQSSDPEITIGVVNRGYRDFFGAGRPESREQSGCQLDVKCPEAVPWHDQIRSVAWYTVLGVEWCSGQLLNNTGQDLTPYFLSAFHCVDFADDDAHATPDDEGSKFTIEDLVDSWVFYWNYESKVCNPRGGGTKKDSQTGGATYQAGWEASDFLLAVLNQKPDAEFNVFYGGWDANGATPAQAVSIHHPLLMEKAVSVAGSPIAVSDYLSQPSNSTRSHWFVPDWSNGAVEHGSSGACLWSDAHLCIGQLHGGDNGCSSREKRPAWFGRLSESWEGGGNAATSLRPWLDPTGTDIKTVAGMDP